MLCQLSDVSVTIVKSYEDSNPVTPPDFLYKYQEVSADD